MIPCQLMQGRHRAHDPPRRWPDKVLGTKYGAAYCDWIVTIRLILIVLAPYLGAALVILLSR